MASQEARAVAADITNSLRTGGEAVYSGDPSTDQILKALHSVDMGPPDTKPDRLEIFEAMLAEMLDHLPAEPSAARDIPSFDQIRVAAARSVGISQQQFDKFYELMGAKDLSEPGVRESLLQQAGISQETWDKFDPAIDTMTERYGARSVYIEYRPPNFMLELGEMFDINLEAGAGIPTHTLYVLSKDRAIKYSAGHEPLALVGSIDRPPVIPQALEL